MLYADDVPPIVAINEGIDIAKKFGTEESGKFVNGVLDRVKLDLPDHSGPFLTKRIELWPGFFQRFIGPIWRQIHRLGRARGDLDPSGYRRADDTSNR